MKSKSLLCVAACGWAGAECSCARGVEVHVEKTHVRRASAVASAAMQLATTEDGPEEGVILMTALMLVERLAIARGCEPRAMLAKMANCFALKRSLMAASRHDA